ncbi:MAG: hypothetical protein R2770_06250 [Acidimicrobiales bacterium]
MTITRAAVVCLAIVAAAGCTSSSGADDAATQGPGTTAATEAAGDRADGAAGPVAGIAAASEVPAHGELPASAPSRLIVAGPGVAGVLELDTQTFDVLATTTPSGHRL